MSSVTLFRTTDKVAHPDGDVPVNRFSFHTRRRHATITTAGIRLADAVLLAKYRRAYPGMVLISNADLFFVKPAAFPLQRMAEGGEIEKGRYGRKQTFRPTTALRRQSMTDL